MERIFKAAGMLLILLAMAGCDFGHQLISGSSTEQPVANVPLALRQRNWTDRYGSGSCVIASTCSAVNWCDEFELAKWLRASYAGGQTARSIQDKLTAAKVPFICTESTDRSVLDYATRTRRAAIIWFFDRHCVTFVGFGVDVFGREVAWLLDNNRVGEFLPIDKHEFLRR